MSEYEANLEDIKTALLDNLPVGLFLGDDIEIMAAALAKNYAERPNPPIKPRS